MRIDLIAQAILPHRPYYVGMALDGGIIALCSQEGELTALTSKLERIDVATLELEPHVYEFALSPAADLLAVGYGGDVDLFSLREGGRRIARYPTGDSSGLVFLDGGRALCTVDFGRQTGQWELRVIDCVSGRLIDAEPLPVRPVGDFMLSVHPEGEVVAVLACDGNGQQWLFWAHYARHRLRVIERFELRDTSVPCFHPAGGEFLTPYSGLDVWRCRFPTGDVLGRLTPEEAFPTADPGEAPDLAFDYDMGYISDTHAIVTETQTGGRYLLALEQMRIVEPVLAGPDGRRFGEDIHAGPFWCLPDGRLLTTDWRFDGNSKSHDNLVSLWDVPATFGRPSGPDPSRPFTRELLASAP